MLTMLMVFTVRDQSTVKYGEYARCFWYGEYARWVGSERKVNFLVLVCFSFLYLLYMQILKYFFGHFQNPVLEIRQTALKCRIKNLRKRAVP